jgi:hypothetical protein
MDRRKSLRRKESKMSESQYYATEVSDADLDAIADAGDFHLEESGFFYLPSQHEIEQLMREGEELL